MWIKKFIPYFILLAGGLMLLEQSFDHFFSTPNRFMLDTGVDGLKNYFNPMFYLKYDTGTHFSGMNYPFGEHLVFTDGQPLIVWILKLFPNSTSLADAIPAIFNLSIFIGIALCMLLIYKISRHFLLPPWYAVCISWIIALLSPQIHRLAGHYALAHTFIIPLVWLLLLKYQGGSRNSKWWYGISLVATLSLSSFLHVYYLMIGSLFVLAFFFVKAIKETPRWRNAASTLILGVLIAVLPLLIFKIFLSLTDPMTDRPSNPYGFFDHMAYWQGVFLPDSGPVLDFVSYFKEIPKVVNEGYAYVGLLSSIVLILTVIRFFRFHLNLGWTRGFKVPLPNGMGVSLYAALLLLLFSMGIPFIWGLESLLDIVKPLKQFRSLGRFAWVFYYIMSVYTAFYLYLIWKRLSMKGLKSFGSGLLAVALLFWAAEAWIHVSLRKERIEKWDHANIMRKPPIDYNQWLSDIGLEKEDFQAILPLPAFFIGSEKLYTESINYYSTRHGMVAAYQTGLPLASGLLSRTSMSQSMLMAQMLSSEWIDKEVLDYYNEKPILLLGHKDAALKVQETKIKMLAEKIGERNEIELYRLSLESLKSHWNTLRDSIEITRSSLRPSKDFLLSDSAWYHFDPIGTDRDGMPDHGEMVKEGPITIFEGSIADSGNYHLSLWVKANLLHDGFPVVFLKEWNSEKTTIQWKEANPKFQTEIYKDFVRVDIPFAAKGNKNVFTVSVEGKFIELSSLLIQKEGVDIYRLYENGNMMFNNYYSEVD